MDTFISDLSKLEFPLSDRVSGKSIANSVMELIRKEHPDFTSDNSISIDELNIYREQYVTEYLVKQIGELTDLERTVITTLSEKATISDKLDGDDEKSFSFGQRVADNVASFGGSWTFIISFAVFLAIWIMVNIIWLANKGFDPYPFILLNLILSCIAAMQAPVIMMSQNRQEEKDRERGKNDYMVNLKSELEIRMLHEKLDHLIINQQQEIMEIHKVQLEMMRQILKRLEQ